MSALVYVVWVVGFTLVGIAVMRLGRNPKIGRAIEWFWTLSRRRIGPPDPPTKDELDYQRQTGVFPGTVQFALFFFMIAFLGVLGFFLNKR